MSKIIKPGEVVNNRRVLSPDEIRADQFKNELEALCIKYGFGLRPYAIIDGDGIKTGLNIVPVRSQENKIEGGK